MDRPDENPGLSTNAVRDKFAESTPGSPSWGRATMLPSSNFVAGGSVSDAAAGPGSGGFSLELGADLVQVRDWLHDFAISVIRPAAAEWDEREETPWPVLEEAAKIGLYSLDFYGQQYLDPSGLGIPIAFEELFWGDA